MENANGVKPFRPDLFLETAEEKELEVSASPYMSFCVAVTNYQQFGGFKTTEIYCLTVLEARNLK